MAAVVQIYVEGYVSEDVKSILNPRLGDIEEWTGSGFFVKCPYGDDIIITNAHVVRNAKSIEIMSMLTSEERFDAQLVGIVKKQEPDIAIIKLKRGVFEKFSNTAKSKIPHLSLRDNSKITRGTRLKAIGYPMGMSEPNITAGEITNFVSGDSLTSEKYVTDAAINPGNSGGPAIDHEGKVIGINTSIYKNADNIGFITPSSFIKIFLKNIFENDGVCFSEIGGHFQKNSPDISLHLQTKNTDGVIVTYIYKGGSLDQATIKEEDIILGLNGKMIDRHGIFKGESFYQRRNIFDVFKLIPIGEKIEFRILRESKEISLKSKAQANPKTKIESKYTINDRKFLDIWGMTVQVLSYDIIEAFNLIDRTILYQIFKNFDENKERLVITHIEKESPAYRQEWSIGEIITSLNGDKITGMQHLLELIKESHDILKMKTELGTIGFFNNNLSNNNLKLKDPSMFLK